MITNAQMHMVEQEGRGACFHVIETYEDEHGKHTNVATFEGPEAEDYAEEHFTMVNDRIADYFEGEPHTHTHVVYPVVSPVVSPEETRADEPEAQAAVEERVRLLEFELAKLKHNLRA